MPTGDDRPFLIRVAGLPASAVQQLRSPELGAAALRLGELEERLMAARQRFADELYALIGDSPKEERRQLLKLRRDCHNNRPLGQRAHEPWWPSIARRCPSAETLTELEDRSETARQDLEREHAEARRRSVSALLEAAGDRSFRRGLSLASPELARRLSALPPGGLDTLAAKRRRKLEASLLRYVSRAAVKLSPYSTLTRLVAGSIRDGVSALPRWTEGEWHEHSLVRVRRYLAEQLTAAWKDDPEVARQLPLVPNRSVERVGEAFRFLRAPAWRLDDQGALAPRPPALTQIAAHPLMAAVLKALPKEVENRGVLVARLAEDLEIPAADCEAIVGKALTLGLIESRAPWSDDCDVMEAELLRGLETIGGTEAAQAPLRQMLEEHQGFAHSSEPQVLAARSRTHLGRTWHALAPRAGLEGVPMWRPNSNEIYEDVLLTPPAGEEPLSAVTFNRRTASSLLEALEPWARIAYFADRRFDFLHTLAAAAAAKAPERKTLGLLELYSLAQPLWTRFVRDEASRSSAWRPAFNPMGVSVISDLETLRTSLREQFQRAFETASDGKVAPEQLAAVADSIPVQYRPATGPCALVQPLDEAGEGWVVNRLFEGTGRYSSRFVSLMAAESRDRFIQAYRQRDEESQALLDLTWNHGDSLAVHPSLLGHALATPGEALPGASKPGAPRIVEPRELSVRLPEDPAGLPILIDRDGRRMIPVTLSGAALRFLPAWLQFVALWGPREIPRVLPAGHWRAGEEVEWHPRLSLGPLVIKRRSWRIPSQLLAQIVASGGAEASATLLQWLEKIGIPQQVFLIESHELADGSRSSKPQYLDLSCPLFVELLSRALRGQSVILEEALPTPTDFPPAYDGQPRGQELVIDSLFQMI